MGKDGTETEFHLSIPARQILSLIFDKRYEDARCLIDIERKRFPESEWHQFKALSAVLQESLGGTEKGLALMREVIQEKPTWLPHLYRFSVMLMGEKHWDEANTILDRLIALSLVQNNAYFLDESRFRKVLCLRMLGREKEFDKAKSYIPAGSTFFMDDGLYRIEDFI